jgi:hypothetical protein
MEKSAEDFAKSHLSVRDKVELWDAFGSFCNRMITAFENNYHELKEKFSCK